MASVLITGCSTGIGRATAVELHKRGFEVIATARRPDSIRDLDVAHTHALDVTDEASVSALAAAVGPVDVLVNNAGLGMHAPVERGPLENFRRVLDTNVLGVVRMVQTFAPQMRERGSGVIVNVSSIAGRVSSPLGGFYSASKFALEALSESLHYELGHFGIRVALVEPGGFDTSFGDNRMIFGVDGPPYDELDRIWEEAQTRLQGASGSRPGPEVVAQTISDAVEGKEQKLRWPVGEDANLVLEVRKATSDEEFEATMRESLGLHW